MSAVIALPKTPCDTSRARRWFQAPDSLPTLNERNRADEKAHSSQSLSQSAFPRNVTDEANVDRKMKNKMKKKLQETLSMNYLWAVVHQSDHEEWWAEHSTYKCGDLLHKKQALILEYKQNSLLIHKNEFTYWNYWFNMIHVFEIHVYMRVCEPFAVTCVSAFIDTIIQIDSIVYLY